MAEAHDRSTFENRYAGRPPWDVDNPQPVFVRVADRISGRVLDAGCGTGENAIYFAKRSCTVTGVDFVDAAIQQANRKAAERNVAATFLVKDALTLRDWDQRFDAAIDSGLFHVFSDDDRRRYVAGLHHVLMPGGRLFLLCFSDAEPGEHGPRRISERALHEAFAKGWSIESLEAARFDVRADFKDMTFSDGGPKAWFLIARREG